jgi:hypothetical protein
MDVNAVPVDVEWALWGKEEGDPGEYRLLRCSKGEIGGNLFRLQLLRYQPGQLTVSELPQVSVSWVKRTADGHGSHIAMAFHETSLNDPQDMPARGRYDMTGREIVFIRYFCVRYEDVARHAISYESLYEGLRDVMLPEADGRPIQVAVQVQPVMASSAERVTARAIAAQLLTGIPVCIVGAGETETLARLRIIDQVMSVLPYGMRGCLSASTWVNNIYTEHHFRLFFAGAPRSGGRANGLDKAGRPAPRDVVIDFARASAAPESIPVADPNAKHYLEWTTQTNVWALTQLARQTEPVHLGRKAEIAKAIRELPTALESGIPAILERMHEALQARDMEYLTELVQHLRRQAADPGAILDRPAYHEIIRARDLLLDTRSRTGDKLYNDLLDVLLSVAVDSPLTYRGYRRLFYCAKGRLHDPLLRAMVKFSLDGPVPLILIYLKLGYRDDDILPMLERKGIAPEEPLRALMRDMARREPEMMLTDDALAVYDIGFNYLRTAAPNAGAALREIGFAASVIERLFPEWDQRVHRQALVLEAYSGGRKLGRMAVRKVLERSGYTVPPPALARAVWTLTRWKSFTERVYFDVCAPDVVGAWPGSDAVGRGAARRRRLLGRRTALARPRGRARHGGGAVRSSRWIPVEVTAIKLGLGLVAVLMLVTVALLATVLH